MRTEIVADLTNVNTQNSVDAEIVETTQHLSTQREEDGSTIESYVTTVFLDGVSAENKEEVGFEGELGVNNTTEDGVQLFAADSYGEHYTQGDDKTNSVRAYAKVYYRTGIISSGIHKGQDFLDLTAVKGTWQNSNSSVTIRDRKVFGKAEYIFWDGRRGTELKQFNQAGDVGPKYATNTTSVVAGPTSVIKCSSVCTLTKGSSTWTLTVTAGIWS